MPQMMHADILQTHHFSGFLPPVVVHRLHGMRLMILAALIGEYKFRMFTALLIKNRLRNTVAHQWSPAFTAFDVAGWNNKHTALKFLQEDFPFPAQVAHHIVAHRSEERRVGK